MWTGSGHCPAGECSTKDINDPICGKIIQNFPEEVGMSTASTPVAEYLFQIQDQKETKPIPEKQAIQFHHNVQSCYSLAPRHAERSRLLLPS